MNDTVIGQARFSSPPFCPEDKFLEHWIGRCLLYLLRGLAATLLMPIEALEHVRRGRAVGWRTGLSWALSAVVWTGFYMLLKGRLPGDHVALLVCALGALLAVALNGRLQAGRDSRKHGSEAWDGGWYHHYHSHWRHGRRHHDASMRGAPERAIAPAGTATSEEGVCCGNCRECREEICLKTGSAKKRVTE